jgi:hypothetical protein
VKGTLHLIERDLETGVDAVFWEVVIGLEQRLRFEAWADERDRGGEAPPTMRG